MPKGVRTEHFLLFCLVIADRAKGEALFVVICPQGFARSLSAQHRARPASFFCREKRIRSR